MLRELLIRELSKYGVNDRVVDRLLLHGYRPYMKWLICRLTDGKNVYNSFETLADLLGVPHHRARYAYFEPLPRTIQEIRRLPEYDFLLSVLIEAHPSRDLWDELLPYAFLCVKKFAIETMLASFENDMYLISEKLNVSLSLAYRVRKDYLTRYVQHKGDYPDDTEPNK